MPNDDPLNTPALPRGALHPKIWLSLTAAVFAAIAAAMLLVERTYPGVEVSSNAPSDSVGEVGPSSLIDHSVVKSKSVVDEPDMTGASVAAYGH